MNRRPLSDLFPPLVPTRRSFIVGSGVAGGLAIAWALWPRSFPVNLVAGPGEAILNAWIKIGDDGHVSVAVPQVELGQGSYTLIPQIVADELGADWRTVGVEPAPLNPVYANQLFAQEWDDGPLGHEPLQVTGGSTTERGFPEIVRQAGAAARILLCKAAAERWDADWRACETSAGFVTRGDERIRFGELAAEAARQSLPAEIPLRTDQAGRINGRGVNRLDIPAKIDGTANFAADIRLPDMLYAAVRQGPLGDSRLLSVDKAAADRISGVLHVVEHEHWVAAVATNWWAAHRAVEVMRPKFKTYGRLISDSDIASALDKALDGEGERLAAAGDLAPLFADARLAKAEYSVGLAAHAALEPMTATVAIDGDRMQLWIATQMPGIAARAAARAIGFDEDKVIVHAMLVGGSFGRKYEVEIAAQAAIIADKVKRPVQLIWSRGEDMRHDRFRPPAKAKLAARLGASGQIEGWLCKIAAPDGVGEMRRRTVDGMSANEARQSAAKKASVNAVAGAVPPYGIATYAVDHHPVDIGIATGKWRAGAHGYSAFFTESFIDELARQSGIEPFSFRMALLGGNPRLALCLSKAASKGGWDGGAPGTGQGIACHSMLGSHIAVLAEANIAENQRVRVTRMVCVADVGQVMNPDVARQQIEGGLLFGMANAIGNHVGVNRGVVSPTRLAKLAVPRLADMPEISVELIVSAQPSGAIGELAVPPVAPAIANALFSSTGRRFRSLPLAPAPIT